MSICTIEIKEYDDVILFVMQRDKKTLLTFAEIWKLCEKASPNLKPPVDPKTEKSRFVSRLLNSIQDLVDAGMVLRHTKDAGGKISHITITRPGIEFIDATIYANQSVVNQ